MAIKSDTIHIKYNVDQYIIVFWIPIYFSPGISPPRSVMQFSDFVHWRIIDETKWVVNIRQCESFDCCIRHGFFDKSELRPARKGNMQIDQN